MELGVGTVGRPGVLSWTFYSDDVRPFSRWFGPKRRVPPPRGTWETMVLGRATFAGTSGRQAERDESPSSEGVPSSKGGKEVQVPGVASTAGTPKAPHAPGDLRVPSALKPKSFRFGAWVAWHERVKTRSRTVHQERSDSPLHPPPEGELISRSTLARLS